MLDATVRHRRAALPLLVVLSLILVSATSAGFGAEPLAASAKAAVASLDLSRGDLYETLAAVDGTLVLSGGPNGSLFASGSGAAGPHLGPSLRCYSAVVDPASLTLSDERSGPCEDPRLYGRRVLPINFIDNGTPRGSNVRIAAVTPNGGYTVGPIVMTYSEYSDTDAEWIYGDGYLWIYDPTTTHGSEVLRVSETTGAVLQTVRTPWVDRPLLATDADGLWLTAAVNSSFNPLSAAGIYRLAPGMKRPVLVRPIKSTADWMVAAGHSVWVAVNGYPQPPTLWRIDAGDANPVLQVRLSSAVGDDVQVGYSQPDFGGNAVDGIWTVQPQQPDQLSQKVIHVDPTTGRFSTVANILPGYVMLYSLTPVVVLHGSLFFLDPPARAATYPYAPEGFSVLYRVTLG